MRERVTALSLSITQQKADLEDDSLPKVVTDIKKLHWTFKSL